VIDREREGHVTLDMTSPIKAIEREFSYMYIQSSKLLILHVRISVRGQHYSIWISREGAATSDVAVKSKSGISSPDEKGKSNKIHLIRIHAQFSDN
jgi:hypothetical protein